jgi:hypothetical protein
VTRLRQALLLAVPALRTTAWPPLLPAGAVGFLALALDGGVVTRLRLAAVALCAGAAFALDDAAAGTTAAAPTPRALGRAVRLALVLPLAGAVWAAQLAVAGEAPAAALTLELAAMLAVTLAVAAAAAERVPDGRGGVAAVPALLGGLALAALLLPDRLTLHAGGPADPRWDGSHLRWAGVLALALAALAYASGDPARPRAGRRLRRRSEPPASVDATEAA